MPQTLAAFRAGLRDLGCTEEKHPQIEFRWAEGNHERLPALAQELIRLNVDARVTHGAAGSLAAKGATLTIPIVVTAVGDMLALGPGGKLVKAGRQMSVGSGCFVSELTAKCLELIKEAGAEF